MHVKIGDTVKVISGRDKGQIGEITKIFKHNSTVIVQDINLKTKHRKSRDEGELGQITQVIIISLARKNIIMNSSTLSVR
jgi:large subunit ribosomal protein L24